MLRGWAAQYFFGRAYRHKQWTILHCKSKNKTLYFCLSLRQMLTSFPNYFTSGLSSRLSLNIPPHLKSCHTRGISEVNCHVRLSHSNSHIHSGHASPPNIADALTPPWVSSGRQESWRCSRGCVNAWVMRQIAAVTTSWLKFSTQRVASRHPTAKLVACCWCCWATQIERHQTNVHVRCVHGRKNEKQRRGDLKEGWSAIKITFSSHRLRRCDDTRRLNQFVLSWRCESHLIIIRN